MNNLLATQTYQPLNADNGCANPLPTRTALGELPTVLNARRGLSPKEAATKAWEEISGKLQGMADLFAEGGTQLVKNSDQLAGNLRNLPCVLPSNINIRINQQSTACPISIIYDAVTAATETAAELGISKNDLVKALLRVTDNSADGGYVINAEAFVKTLRAQSGSISGLKGVYNEIVHTHNLRSQGFKPLSVGAGKSSNVRQDVPGYGVVEADVDVISMRLADGKPIYDDVKSSLTSERVKIEPPDSQAWRFANVSKAAFATPRWVVMDTTNISSGALADLRSVGIDVVDRLVNLLN
jgi:hypothetical protein